MKPSSGAISVAASARKTDVNNRIPLRNCYRIANNLLKQVDIYRSKKNIIDLYVVLRRFSSLITETISHHQDYLFTKQQALFQRDPLICHAPTRRLSQDTPSWVQVVFTGNGSHLMSIIGFNIQAFWIPLQSRFQVYFLK